MKNINLRYRQLRFRESFILMLLCALLISSCETDETQRVTNFENLILDEDFDQDGAPDPALWGYDLGTGENGWGNQELQYYTNRESNVTVQNGVLLITARRENFQGSNYTSARLITRDRFEQAYGRFEARIRLPYGQGIWPAFWMLGASDTEVWPNIGEIDIMEYRGQEPTVVLGSMHGPGYSGGEAITKRYELEGDRFDTGFHIFGIEWTPEYVNFYVDDVLYNQITRADVPGEWVFDNPFYMLMNVAVGGTFVGPPNTEAEFPQTMLVDYVRVYEYEDYNF
ncbi:glycoside hydrolase family 16 protein [Croceiramulus getboli]|nr:glycoside hydrolase family 16 protein [Flavobacteriaceae bacterium YJPT1-3]